MEENIRKLGTEVLCARQEVQTATKQYRAAVEKSVDLKKPVLRSDPRLGQRSREMDNVQADRPLVRAQDGV